MFNFLKKKKPKIQKFNVIRELIIFADHFKERHEKVLFYSSFVGIFCKLTEDYCHLLVLEKNRNKVLVNQILRLRLKMDDVQDDSFSDVRLTFFIVLLRFIFIFKKYTIQHSIFTEEYRKQNWEVYKLWAFFEVELLYLMWFFFLKYYLRGFLKFLGCLIFYRLLFAFLKLLKDLGY